AKYRVLSGFAARSPQAVLTSKGAQNFLKSKDCRFWMQKSTSFDAGVCLYVIDHKKQGSSYFG
ncbi:MAG TPA: hypothetical protein DIW36_06555, partial [Ruminococcaceae bacterium]|nr:hypothetical protein [Oscillospiraceae bacterium]